MKNKCQICKREMKYPCIITDFLKESNKIAYIGISKLCRHYCVCLECMLSFELQNNNMENKDIGFWIRVITEVKRK